MTLTFDTTSISVLDLECTFEASNSTRCVKVLSSCSMIQLHAILLESFNIAYSEESEHMFKTLPYNPSNKLRNITYVPISSPEHYDGWLTLVAPGIYVQHSHPHAPLENNSNKFILAQVRAEQIWAVGLAITLESPEMQYSLATNGLNLTIHLKLKGIQPATHDDFSCFYSLIYNQCRLCHITKCNEDYPDYSPAGKSCGFSTGKPCCDYCLTPNLQGWQGVGTNVEFEGKIYELLNQTVGYIKQERNTFIEAQNMRCLNRSSNNTTNFHCEWIESTGETCVYCTEGFL